MATHSQPLTTAQTNALFKSGYYARYHAEYHAYNVFDEGQARDWPILWNVTNQALNAYAVEVIGIADHNSDPNSDSDSVSIPNQWRGPEQRHG